jgi:GTPase-associated system helical domain
MTEILFELVKTGLIEKLDGDDSRFKKMQAASSALAKAFCKDRYQLIPAILAALDTKIVATAPMLMKAKEALLREWPTLDSVYPDPPIMLLRAILFDACQRASSGVNSAILWLSAVDTLPYSTLGKEEAAVRQMLNGFADDMGREIANATSTKVKRVTAVQMETSALAAEYEPFTVDRAQLHNRIVAAFCPQQENGQPALVNPNPHWSNQTHQWSWEAAKRLHVTLADEFDALAQNISEQQSESHSQLLTSLKTFEANVQDAIEESLSKTSAEKIQLNTLWWFEALYSPSLRMSYRELDPQLAAVVMAIDLLAVCTSVPATSVAYVLAEAVARLPNAGYEKPLPLASIIANLSKLKAALPESWLTALAPAPKDGRLSLRDVAFCALANAQTDAEKLLKRAAVPPETTISLPQFARAIFRQEQALRLATGAKL